MKFEEFKKQHLREELGISNEFKNIHSFVDFGNVNKWFEKDRQDWNSQQLANNEFISIDIERLKKFADLFSNRTRCYYGKFPNDERSFKFNYALV